MSAIPAAPSHVELLHSKYTVLRLDEGVTVRGEVWDVLSR